MHKVHVRNGQGELEAFDADPLASNPKLCTATIDGIPYIFATPGTVPIKQAPPKFTSIPSIRIAKNTGKAVLAERKDGTQKWYPLSVLGEQSVTEEGDFGVLVVAAWALEGGR